MTEWLSTDWITTTVVARVLLGACILLLLGIAVTRIIKAFTGGTRSRRTGRVSPAPTAATLPGTPAPPPKNSAPTTDAGVKGWQKARDLAFWAITWLIIPAISGLLIVAISGLLIWAIISWDVTQNAWRVSWDLWHIATTFPDRPRGKRTDSVVSTEPRKKVERIPLGTECPELHRDERQTCKVHHESDWIEFESGPQMTGYMFRIGPDYDQDRLLPEKDQVVRELWFRLADGTEYKYEGRPIPQMATAFRGIYNRPTTVTYEMRKAEEILGTE